MQLEASGRASQHVDRQESLYTKVCISIGITATVTLFLDKLLKLVSKMLENPSPSLSTSRDIIGRTIIVLGFVDLLSKLNWALFQRKKDWKHTAAMVCKLSRRSYMCLTTIDKQFDALPFIRNVPILELASNALRIGGSVLSLSRHYDENTKLNRDHDACQNRLKMWQSGKDYLEGMEVTASKAGLVLSEDSIKSIVCLQIVQDFQQRNVGKPISLLAIKDHIGQQVQSNQRTLSLIDKNKIDKRGALVNDVNKLALGILSMTAFITGATVLASSGWLMLSLTVCVRGYGAYRTISSICCPPPRYS